MDHAGQAHVLLTNFLEFRSVLMDHHVRLNKCQEVCKEWHGMALGWILGVIASVAATGLTYLAFLVGRHIFGG